MAQRLHPPCRGKGRAGAGLPKPISPADPNFSSGDAPAVASQLAGFCWFSPLRTFQRMVMTAAEHKQGSRTLMWGHRLVPMEPCSHSAGGGVGNKLCARGGSTTRADS